MLIDINLSTDYDNLHNIQKLIQTNFRLTIKKARLYDGLLCATEAILLNSRYFLCALERDVNRKIRYNILQKKH